MGKTRFSLRVYNERCKDCGICFAFCPQENLRPDKDGSPELINKEACIGCKLCEYLCPDFAIQVQKIEQEASKQESRRVVNDAEYL